jgi:hypothetical protein
MNMTLNIIIEPVQFKFYYTSFITESDQIEREILIKQCKSVKQFDFLKENAWSCEQFVSDVR